MNAPTLPTAPIVSSRPRYPGTLSAWHLGRLRCTPGWWVHSKQWRLAHTLKRHVGYSVELTTLGRLSGYSRSSLMRRLSQWRSAGVLATTAFNRRPAVLLQVDRFDLGAIEMPKREQMITDVLTAMQRVGEAATAYRIAEVSGWDRGAVARLLKVMERERVVYDVSEARRKLYQLPGGWTFAPIGGAR